MSHYFQYLYTTCETFDGDCNGCKYRDEHKLCFLRLVLNSSNDYLFGVPTTWKGFNHIDKKKMVFLEGI